MVDIHTHILPKMDDGASSLEESLEMCAAAAESGVKTIVATPHFYDVEATDAFLEKREERLALLKNGLAESGQSLEIRVGAEVAMRPELYSRRDQLKRLSLGDTRYLLAEMPFSPIPMQEVFDYVELIFDQDLIPVIAHPERYAYFQENYDIPNLLLEKGAVLASDAHEAYGRRGADLLAIRDLLFAQGIPESLLSRMMEETPGQIMADVDIFDRQIGYILPLKRFGR